MAMYLVKEVTCVYKKTEHKIPFGKIRRSSDAADYFRKIIGDQIDVREHCYAIFLSRNASVLGYYTICIGGSSRAIVDVKLLFSSALTCGADSIILGHNHPSGELIASRADKEITKDIDKIGELMDIKLRDHVIVTQDSHYSFADDGLL